MAKEYLKVGEKKRIDGTLMFKPDEYSDGLVDGCIFKDEEAYENDWNAVCYIPEHAFDHCEKDSEGFYEVTGYTHNDLLDMCYGNREWCDYLFQSKCLWAYPDTYMTEWDDEDIAYFYRFIKPGAKVWWNDPAGETSGVYEVFGVPFEFDKNGEPVNPEDFSMDAIILIGNEYSGAEVTPNELTPIYPDLINNNK